MAQFTESVNRFVGGARGRMRRVPALVALEVTANLIEDTPVDTGHARANWLPSIGAPMTEIVGSSDSVDSGTQATAIAEIAAYGESLRGVRSFFSFASALLGGTEAEIYISNNVPYINRLNQGHSPQAPPGFIESAIERGVASALAEVRRG